MGNVPSVVSARVSFDASASNRCASNDTTVRHAPLTEMLSPRRTSASLPRQRADVDAQARIAAAHVARGQPADAFDQSGEHQAAFLRACTNNGQRSVRTVAGSPHAASMAGANARDGIRAIMRIAMTACVAE